MVRMLNSAPPTGRVGRYPKHTFNIEAMPFTAQPFMIAPVLPMETLKNLKFESRVVSDSVVSPLIGWKQEYYIFYVKVTDLLNDTIRDMFIDPANTDLATTMGVAANSQSYYTAKGGIDYLARCVSAIWKHYFSDQDDVQTDYDVATAGSQQLVPFVQVRDRFWMDSLTDKDDMPAGADPADATSMEHLAALQLAYEQLLSLGIANMTYEDFLRSYGVRVPDQMENRPELLARFSDFQYPSNTVEPTTGVPTSALSWVFNNSVRDPKMFKEPGFVVGIAVTRPKVYFSGLAGNMAAHLSRAWDWLPNYLNENADDPAPWSSLKKFGADTGPLGDRTTATDAYWADMRDLFLYGDQFQNRAAFNAVPASVPALNAFPIPPGDAMTQYKYPTEAMVKSLFVDTEGTKQFVRHDGYCNLTIQGRQVDYTVGNLAQA